jgi:hypothetical protein
MATEDEVIQNLPPATWGSLDAVPTSVVSTDISLRLVPREYYGLDGEGHDNTGRRSMKWRTRMHFVNTVKATLYPSVWAQWRDKIVVGERDSFRHPDLGQVQARAEGSTFEIVARSTRGITVDINWVESVEPDDQTAPDESPPNDELKSTASEADETMAETGNDYPSGFESGDVSSDFSTTT